MFGVLNSFVVTGRSGLLSGVKGLAALGLLAVTMITMVGLAGRFHCIYFLSYIYICMYIYLSIHVLLYVCIICTLIQVYSIRIHTYTYIRTCIHTYLRTQRHTISSVRMSVYIYTHTHILLVVAPACNASSTKNQPTTKHQQT